MSDLPQRVHHLTPPPRRYFLLERLPKYIASSGAVLHDVVQPVPALPKHRPDTASLFPLTEGERTVAMIWHEVLHCENVGLDDNFFTVGGHTLAMAQVHSKLQEIYGTAVSLIDMFRYPTIRALGRYVSQQASPAGNPRTLDVTGKDVALNTTRNAPTLP